MSTRNSITRQLLSTEPNSISAEIRRIRQFVTGQLCDIRKLLHTDVLKAKLELEKTGIFAGTVSVHPASA